MHSTRLNHRSRGSALSTRPRTVDSSASSVNSATAKPPNKAAIRTFLTQCVSRREEQINFVRQAKIDCQGELDYIERKREEFLQVGDEKSAARMDELITELNESINDWHATEFRLTEQLKKF